MNPMLTRRRLRERGAGSDSEATTAWCVAFKGQDMRFVGKSAVITGASEGIGFAIAAGLVEEGARVVLVARREDKLEGSWGPMPRTWWETSRAGRRPSAPWKRR